MSSLFVSSRRAIIIVASLFIVVLFLSLHSSEQVSGKLSTWRMQIGQSVRRNETGLMPLRDAEAFCSSVGMEPWLERSLRRKVFDLTLINTELDWLEIRMGQLWDQVDYFVVVEATRTFTNKPKPLYVQEQLHRFERFYPKLIYHVLDVDKLKVDFGGLGSHKERERYQRNSNIDFVFPGLLGEQRPEAGDVLLVSDLDEVPKPWALTALRNCNFGLHNILNAQHMYYSFQWRQPGLTWPRPQATVYTGSPNTTIHPEELRDIPAEEDKEKTVLADSAWHCSCCFDTVQEMITKMGSFAHADELDTEENRRPEEVVRRVRDGLDVFGRDIVYERVPEDEMDYPEYLRKHKERFPWMLSRDGENAGFVDYP